MYPSLDDAISAEPLPPLPRSQETVRPYDPDSKCPKCDTGGATTAWRSGNLRLSLSRGLGTVRALGNVEPGWMMRVCRVCEYAWAESPVDA